ncbi:FecR family protein [Paenibacillus eucommiae]|uniref:FecR protein domain-containing protein n=1 Tax=Paenibacillus eucommiae TaxID=1355755 RepID=A0ABS4INV3_9BACL|nr:FecR domain-containing protein [Paenibacillus eucommiae]MBP1989241.1 hypothetical protein [Paenibacillus eucommiae]
MELFLHNRCFKNKSFVAMLMSCVLVFGLLSSALAGTAEAKTVRVAIVSSLSGDVTVKKGGGSQKYDAYEGMSLNQGDTLYTGSNGSVKLNVSSNDAEVTLSSNAELNVSDLSTSNGSKKSKFKVWAGSIWVKVKSLAGTSDKFEMETPTAVMAVRGTKVLTSVDPVTGQTYVSVAAGKVETTVQNDNQDDEQQSDSVTILNPSQQISLDSRDEVNDLELKVSIVDVNDLISQVSSSIIEAIIRDKASIDLENEEFIALMKKKIAEGAIGELGDSTLVIKDQAELDRVKANLDNLIGNIVKAAIADKKVDKQAIDKIIEDINKLITDPAKKLDLDKVKPIDKTAGVDAELEKKKQEQLKLLEAQKKLKKEEELKKLQEQKNKLKDALEKLELEKKRIEEANKKAEAEAKAKAEAELLKKLDNEAKKKFLEEKAKLDKKDQSTTTPSTPSTSNPNPDPGTNPPVLTPTVSFKSTEPDSLGKFKLTLELKDFAGANAIFGAEVHLLYDGNITADKINASYIATNANPVFGPQNSVEHIAVYPQNQEAQLRELVYAITNYNNSDPAITVSGTKTLVTFNFQISPDSRPGVSSESKITIPANGIILVTKNGTRIPVTLPSPTQTIIPFSSFILEP